MQPSDPSISVSDVTLARTGNLALLPIGALLGVKPAGSLSALNGFDFTVRPFRANHQTELSNSRALFSARVAAKQDAPPPRPQERGFRRGDPR